MTYTYEVHLHTDESSRCGRSPAREYIPFYMDQGYDGIVVTDHFYGNPSYVPDRSAPWAQQINEYCRGYEEALDEGIRRGFKVFFGIEQQFANDECLIYGPDKQWLLDHPDMPAWSRKQLFDEIEKIGGCIVLAHPFRVRDYVEKITVHRCVHAVEIFNSANRPVDDAYAVRYAAHYGYPVTVGSDMHHTKTKNELYGVVFDEPWTDVFDYVRAIREKKPFGIKADMSRAQTPLQPLERPYEYMDANGLYLPWDVAQILSASTKQP